MRKNIIIGAGAIIAGLLIALGPQFLFKVCPQESNGDWLQCHWSVQALLGTGIIIAALGFCIVLFSDLKTHVGLVVGIFFAGIVSLAIPYSLIKGCNKELEMACTEVTFPIITVLGAVVLAGSAAYMVYLWKKVKV